MVVTTLPPIFLKSPIILKSPSRKPKSKFLRVLTSPKTTLGLVGILTTLIAPLRVAKIALGAAKFVAPKTLKGALIATATIPTAAIVLTQSKRAREAAKFVIDPRKAPEKARIISGIIEDPSKLLPKERTGASLKEKVIEVGKAAGIIGGVTALVAGSVAVVAKKIKDIKLPSISLPKKKVSSKVAAAALPVGLLPAPASITTTTQPLGAVQQPIEELPVVVKEAKPMKITNTFNPTIDIRFSKSKRFINQQINLRR